MISPSAKLIVLSTLLAIPACTIAFLRPDLLFLCGFVLVALAAIGTFDVRLGIQRTSAVTLNGQPSLKWFKNRPAQLTLQVNNLLNQRLSVAIDWPSGLEVAEAVMDAPAMSAEIVFSVNPLERGRYNLQRAYVRTQSPLSFWHIRSTHQLQIDIRVFPDLEREPGAKLLLLRKLGGVRTLRSIGRGREFERLREYTPGDTYDEIAWKASARRGRPIVRVFQVERTQDVYAIVDSSRLAARGKALEQYVSAALMLAIAAENNADNFGLISFGDKVNHFVAPGRGRLHFTRCRDAIFDLHPSSVSPDFAELFSFIQLRVRRRSLLVFLTDLNDPLLSEAFLRDIHLLSRRHLVLVNRLGDDQVRPVFTGQSPATVDEINLRLSGHLQWATLQEMERNLNHLGVRTSLLTPGAAGLDLVRLYTDVKRRQAI